jgi:chromosome segregation protein
MEAKAALQNEYYQIEKQIREVEYKSREQANVISTLNTREHYLNNLISEVSVIIGSSFLIKSKSFTPEASNILASKSTFELEKMLQRSKIKLEEAGVVDAAGVLVEYEELKKRDEFLAKEIEDLKSTEAKLLALISELRDTLKVDFKKGIEKISFVFNNYFHEVFAGGRAKLHIKETKIENKYTTADGKEVTEVERQEELEIDVDLPDKKVKDLNMLSGGERSLTSIALIFAMSSIAPPPFIVLDETDAALDEQNALRYGKMLSKLAEKSKLLVITHNRQTMNECDLLYGITIASDGASRLLSIKFDK